MEVNTALFSVIVMSLISILELSECDEYVMSIECIFRGCLPMVQDGILVNYINMSNFHNVGLILTRNTALFSTVEIWT